MLTEISNGQLGICIPNQSTYSGNPNQVLAPIQYFIYSDGTKSDDTPNYLQMLYPGKGGSGPLSMRVTWLKEDPSEYAVRIEYTFKKNDFNFYDKHYPGGEAGMGYYKSTINIKNGEKSIMVLEEFDYEISYAVQISAGLNPTKARYRGWNSSSPEYGYEKPGISYRNVIERGYSMDATVDLPGNQHVNLPYLPYWSVSGGEQNTGRYWMLYNDKSGIQSNLFGIFSGRPSKLLGGNGYGIAISSVETGKNEEKKFNLNIWMERRGPDNSWYPKKRFEWGIFLSTKKDLLPPEKIQPILLEMNNKSGLGRKIDKYATTNASLNTHFFQAAIFSDAMRMQKLIKRIKTDDPFYNYMIRTDSYYKPVFDAWKWKDSARSLINELIGFRTELLKNYKTGDGCFKEEFRYWKGANLFKVRAITIACLFADKDISMSPTEKTALISLVNMMARVIWDDDNVPLFDNAGVSFGTANMPSQYLNTRYFFALLFSGDKEFAGRAQKVSKEVKNLIDVYIRPNGSTSGTPHYTQPAMDPILFSMLQLKNAGVADYFKSSPLISKFTDFYCSLLTPPSVRFMLNRKLISFGDGSEESAVTFALLASGFENINPVLSQQLDDIYAHGPRRLSPFGPVFMVVDFSNVSNTPYSFNASNFKGYMSHLRVGSNNQSETALWFLNGDTYNDHRNDDAGESAIYALKAPLSLSRSSFYYPHATDGRIRTMVIPQSLFPEWDGSSVPINERSLQSRTWPVSNQEEFAKLGNLQIASGVFNRENNSWNRKIILSAKNQHKPIIIIMDQLRNKERNIWSMNFMSEGPVQTPGGPVSPIVKIHNNGDKQELPVATPVYNLPAEIGKFTFTGQSWNKKFHPAGGINWDLYTISTDPMQFTMSQWTTTWQNSAEADDFLSSNGRAYAEGQQILRLKGGSEFFVIILPYNKGESYKIPISKLAPGLYLLQDGKDSTLISRTGIYCRNSESIIVSAWGKKNVTISGYSITGGPAEMEVTQKNVKVRIHGNSGDRVFRVPFEVISASTGSDKIKIFSNQQYSEWTIPYVNKEMNLLSTEQGYTEYQFNIK